MTRSRLVVVILAASVAALALISTGCDTFGGSTQDDSAALEGKTWQATEIAGVTAVITDGATQSTAEFAAGRVSGSGGVNRYTGGYTTEPGNKITITSPASTMMAGPPEAMAQEAAFFKALSQAATFEVTEESLKLMDEAGATVVAFKVLEPTPLVGTEWVAVSINNGKQALQGAEADAEVTALFADDGSLTGSAGVNRYNGKYATSGEDQMTIDTAITTTKMAGPENLMTQETAYLAALPKTATYTIEGDELWLRDSGGAALVQYKAK